MQRDRQHLYPSGLVRAASIIWSTDQPPKPKSSTLKLAQVQHHFVNTQRLQTTANNKLDAGIEALDHKVPNWKLLFFLEDISVNPSEPGVDRRSPASLGVTEFSSRPSPASLGFTDYSQSDKLVVRHKFDAFGARKNLGALERSAQID